MEGHSQQQQQLESGKQHHEMTMMMMMVIVETCEHTAGLTPTALSLEIYKNVYIFVWILPSGTDRRLSEQNQTVLLF